MNLALHAEGKKKVNPLVILGVRFTKLIINHLQSKHKFHKRPGSLLYLPTEEFALGYLKFSFKNTKRVRFGMAIPDTLISKEIRTAASYSEYVAKVTKYQRYLIGEAVSDDDAPAPKPAKEATTKSTRKPKPQSSKTAPVASKTSKSSASQPSKPTPAPAKPQQKKRKLVEDTTEAPSQAKRSKAGKVLKKGTLSSTHQLVDEFVDEGVPDKEPMHGNKEADTQRAIEESLKEAQGAHRGPLPPVVFREADTGKIQPLPEVEGKGKEKIGEEKAAQGGTNPEDDGVSQTPSSHVVYAGPNLDHMDLGIAEASSQPNTEQMDDEFTSTAYPKVRENLKLPTEGGVRLEEPASSAGTLSSMKNLDKEFNFTDQFLVEKSQEDKPEKTNTEAEVQSMVTVPIYQDTSSVPLMTTPVIDITDPQSDSITVPASMPTTTATVTETITTAPPPPPQPQQDVSTSILTQTIVKEVVTASVQHAMRAPIRARFKDLPTSDMKEILLQRMLEENYDKDHEDHKMAFEALQKSIIRDESEQFDADKAEERTKKKSKQDSPKTLPGSPPPPPPPPPPSGLSGASGPTGTSDSAQDHPLPPPSLTTNQGDQSHSSAAPGSSKTGASTAYTAWTTTISRLKPAASSVPEDVLMHEESDFEAQDMGSDDEDSGSRHIPKVSLTQEWFKPLSEEERPATPELAWSIPSSSLPISDNHWASAIASGFVSPPENSLLLQTSDIRVFIDWFCKKQGITELTPEHLEGPAYEVVKAFHPEVTIQTEFFFNKDLEYLRFSHKGDRLALSVTKMKVAFYPDAGLEQMVPDQMWAEEEYMYDISASYGLTWESKVSSALRSPEPPTAQRQEDSLYCCQPMDKEFATGLEFMHDYKILDSLPVVVFRDKYGMQMIMRFNEIHKFSDGTLQQIDEALDYRIKEFKVNKKRLKLRRIFRNLESFVGGRIREGDYRLLQRTE
ncbi:hypothetical protein Tco_0139715 [Tanacetum coccineum]